MIACAKMIGITPAELMRIGMKVFCPSLIRPRPMTLRGIWIGIRRAPTVTAITPATTKSMTAIRMIRPWIDITPVSMNCSVRAVPGRKPCMIEKKIIRLIPLPMPRSVIRSPSHMTKRAPVVSVTTLVMRKPNPGSGTAPCCSAKIAKP